MNLPFDHVVLLVHDLDAAARDFEALGFTVLERRDLNASHGSTVFRFVSLADGSYILLTAFASDEAMAKHRLGPVLIEGEGHADYSFTVPDAHATSDKLKSVGRPVAGPVSVSNTVEGGTRWGLDLLMLGRGAGGDVALPFVVSDKEGRSARIPGPSDHANGARAMRGIRVSSPDPKTVAATLIEIGGSEAGSSPLHAGDTRIAFGDTWIDIAPVGVPGSRSGGGILEVALGRGDTTAPDAAGTILDPALSHGGMIRMLGA